MILIQGSSTHFWYALEINFRSAWFLLKELGVTKNRHIEIRRQLKHSGKICSFRGRAIKATFLGLDSIIEINSDYSLVLNRRHAVIVDTALRGQNSVNYLTALLKFYSQVLSYHDEHLHYHLEHFTSVSWCRLDQILNCQKMMHENNRNKSSWHILDSNHPDIDGLEMFWKGSWNDTDVRADTFEEMDPENLYTYRYGRLFSPIFEEHQQMDLADSWVKGGNP